MICIFYLNASLWLSCFYKINVLAAIKTYFFYITRPTFLRDNLYVQVIPLGIKSNTRNRLFIKIPQQFVEESEKHNSLLDILTTLDQSLFSESASHLNTKCYLLWSSGFPIKLLKPNYKTHKTALVFRYLFILGELNTVEPLSCLVMQIMCIVKHGTIL